MRPRKLEREPLLDEDVVISGEVDCDGEVGGWIDSDWARLGSTFWLWIQLRCSSKPGPSPEPIPAGAIISDGRRGGRTATRTMDWTGGPELGWVRTFDRVEVDDPLFGCVTVIPPWVAGCGVCLIVEKQTELSIVEPMPVSFNGLKLNVVPPFQDLGLVRYLVFNMTPPRSQVYSRSQL